MRNGPDLERFRPVEPDPDLRRGRKHLIAYLGIMGPQDGVDHAVRALAWLHERRQDWHAVFIGEGDVLEEMRALAAELGLEDAIEFAGWRGDDDIRRILSTADVCLAPDPPSPLNDVSTMIKIPEYLAMGCPVVSYDLARVARVRRRAALYADARRPGGPRPRRARAARGPRAARAHGRDRPRAGGERAGLAALEPRAARRLRPRDRRELVVPGDEQSRATPPAARGRRATALNLSRRTHRRSRCLDLQVVRAAAWTTRISHGCALTTQGPSSF